MNGANLRDAAEHCLATCEGRYDGTSIAAVLMARHILGTVPAADLPAEPFPPRWLPAGEKPDAEGWWIVSIGDIVEMTNINKARGKIFLDERFCKPAARFAPWDAPRPPSEGT